MSVDQPSTPTDQAPAPPHQLLGELRLLEFDAYEFHANRHWKAGQRNSRIRRFGHFAIISLNIVLASALWGLLSTPPWLTGTLSLVAALLGALMLHFKTDEQMALHSSLGATYAQFARKVRTQRHQIETGHIASAPGWQTLEQLMNEFADIQTRAHSAHVGFDITQKRLAQTQAKRESLLQSINAPVSASAQREAGPSPIKETNP